MLTPADAEKLVHAFISLRLDYCNPLFFGIPGKNIQKLQYIQNSPELPGSWWESENNR